MPNSTDPSDVTQPSAPTGAENVTWNLADLYAAIDDPAIWQNGLAILDELVREAVELADVGDSNRT